MQDCESLRALYEARRFDEVWQEYRRLLQAGAVNAEVHLLGALAARFLPTADYRQARQAFERAEAAGPTGITLGKFRLSYGILLREMGETTASIEYLEAFLADIAAYSDLRAVCLGVAHYNLALALRCARRFPEALRAYVIACQEFRQNNFHEHLRKGLQNLAWLHCLMGNAPAAEAALLEAEDLCKSEEARWHQRLGWAYLDLVSGERTSALTRCETILRSEASAPPDVVSHAYWVAGQVALALGQMEQAGMMADQAISWSLKVKEDVRPMHDANSLRREIYQTRVHKNQTGA